jgi:hypothetical protein
MVRACRYPLEREVAECDVYRSNGPSYLH